MRDFFRLFSDTSVYREIAFWSKTQTFFTFFLLYFFVGIAQAAQFLLQTKPIWQQQAQETWDNLAEQWPENTTLTYNDGQLQASPSGRITLKYPPTFPEWNTLPKNLVSIDTSVQNKDDFQEKESLLLITAQEMGGFEAPGQYRWISLRDAFPEQEKSDEPAVFSRETFSTEREHLNDFISLFSSLWAGGIFIMSVTLLPLIRLAIAGIFSLFLPPVFAAFGNTKTQQKVWRVGFLLLPLAEIARLVVNLASQSSLSIFWILWIGMIVIVNATNQRKIR